MEGMQAGEFSRMEESWHVHNPQNKPVAILPHIYGFNNGGSDECYEGQLISEDGYWLGSHICSSEGFMYGDLGIMKDTRADRHKLFQKHYPSGYRMSFVSYSEARSHQGLQDALNKARALGSEAYAAERSDAKVEVKFDKSDNK